MSESNTTGVKAADAAYELTERERMVLEQCVDGADICDLAMANVLRKIEKHRPELVDIGEPKNEQAGPGIVPYLGAITTEAGREYLQAHSEAAGEAVDS